MGRTFTIESEDLEKLEKNLSRLGNESETAVNEILHEMGAETVTQDVTDLLHVSVKNKQHAKFSKPFETNPINLGFIFRTKGGAAKNKNSFGYLVFPDEGRGPRNPLEQNFAGRGIDKARPKIIDELQEVITKKLQEGILNA